MTEATRVNKQDGKILVSFTFLLSLLAICGVCYLYYYGMLFRQHLESKINDLNLRYTISIVRQAETLQQLQSKTSAIEKHIDSMSKTNITIYQVSELINLANQVLIVYDDVPSAIQLLNYANNQLNENNNPVFTQLKYALGDDIVHLSQVPNLNLAALGGELDAISDSVTKLVLTPNNTMHKIVTATNNETKWHKFFNNIQQSIYGLVRVTNTNNTVLLLPDSELIARQNIRLYLLNAKVALLNHDEKSWDYNLESAKNYMNSYFTTYANADKIDAKLDELLKVNVGSSNVTIDATINALNKLKNLQN